MMSGAMPICDSYPIGLTDPIPQNYVIRAMILICILGALTLTGYVIEKCKDNSGSKTKPCPPCQDNPPCEVDRGHEHGPCKFPDPTHWHFRKYNQDPETCDCFLSERQFGGCGTGWLRGCIETL